MYYLNLSGDYFLSEEWKIKGNTPLEKLVDRVARVQNPWIEQMSNKKKQKFERDKEVIEKYIKEFLLNLNRGVENGK